MFCSKTVSSLRPKQLARSVQKSCPPKCEGCPKYPLVAPILVSGLLTITNKTFLISRKLLQFLSPYMTSKHHLFHHFAQAFNISSILRLCVWSPNYKKTEPYQQKYKRNYSVNLKDTMLQVEKQLQMLNLVFYWL